MKKTSIISHILLAGALSVSLSACTESLDQYPHTETTSKEVYNSMENYRAVLGKIYTSMTTTGQGKGGDNPDLSSNEGQDYMRDFFNLQEDGTDEVASTWLSGDKTGDLTYLSWDANDPWVSDMYYRIYYNITLCNEFLRHCSPETIVNCCQRRRPGQPAPLPCRSPFMRALFYYHALDLFRYIPFVTENDPVGSFTPPRYEPQQTFDYIESELKDMRHRPLPRQ
jgi:hypothetical protein